MNVPVTTTTLLRLIALSIGGFALAAVAPASADPFASGIALVLAVFSGTMLALLVSQAAGRRQRLNEAVRTELNKLRRVYHLSKNLSAASPKYRGWFTDVHGFLYGYLTKFGGKDFDSYDEFNADFRKLSYHIYTLPDLETKKEEALFDDLLRTTATVAEARQQIKETWDSRLSAYSWVVVMLMSAGLIVSVILAMGDTLASRFSTGAAVVAVLLALDLLWEVDTMASEKKALAERYAGNIGRLELGRRE
jgi:hypothetical protein